MYRKLTGIAASSGVAIAKAFVHAEPDMTIELRKVQDTAIEEKRLDDALAKAKEELSVIKDKTEKELGADKAEIFAAHLLVLSDPELVGAVKEKITNEKQNAEYAMNEVSSMFISMFENMDNEYMKERASDIRDVSKRVLGHLLGIEAGSLATISEETIIIAEDLTPSDTAQLNPVFIKGFATDIGGRTSHSAIMSRSLEIPAVVGAKEVTSVIENGMTVIIDGLEGDVIVDPSEEEIAHIQKKT